MAKTLRDLFRPRPRPASFEERAVAALNIINARITQTMAKLDDLLEQSRQALEAARKNTDATAAFAGIVQNYKDQLSALQTDLDAARADNDPAKLEELSNNLRALTESIDADTVAEAAVAGTDAEPVN